MLESWGEEHLLPLFIMLDKNPNYPYTLSDKDTDDQDAAEINSTDMPTEINPTDMLTTDLSQQLTGDLSDTIFQYPTTKYHPDLAV